MPINPASERWLELNNRRQAQRRITLGEWLIDNAKTFSVLNQVLSESLCEYIEDEKSPEDCWEDCFAAIDLITDLCLLMRQAMQKAADDFETEYESLTIVNRFSCGEHRTSTIALPVLLPLEPEATAES